MVDRSITILDTSKELESDLMSYPLLITWSDKSGRRTPALPKRVLTVD